MDAIAVDRACVVVPAFEAARRLPGVVADLRATIPELASSVIVVDDGSRDGTGEAAERLGCTVVAHARNRGKGAALRTGFAAAKEHGFDVALTVDADGQHPASEARRVLTAERDARALVLGVRDLAGAGAPKKNRASNAISNFFLSRFAGRPLADTQCGLRRYPIAETLALGARGDGYDFEAEVLLLAIWRGLAVVEARVDVLYPPDRVTHFHVARDPWRIIRTVLRAAAARRRPDARGA